MTRTRGKLNKNAILQLEKSLSVSGILRSRESVPGERIFDVNAPTVQLQKNQAVVNGAGRLAFAANTLYIPAYTVGIGVTPGSGYSAPSDGIYQVDATIAVSGAVIGVYAGAVLVDNLVASGTQSFQTTSAAARGAACVNIHGVVHAAAGQNINVGVQSLHGGLTTIGSEDLVHAPAANMRVIKLGSDELSFNES